MQRGIFQLNRHQGIPRADVEGTARLVIGPDGALAAHQGLGSGEPLDPHRGISAGQQVFVIRMEQRLVVRHFDVASQHRIHQVADGAASGRPEQLWNAGQLIEVIVDDGLAGDGKQLAIGSQLDGGAGIGQGDVLVFRPLPHLAQAGDVAQTDAAGHLEVGQGAFARPLVEGFLGIFPAFQHRLVGDIQQDLAKVGTGVSEGHANIGHRGMAAGLNATAIQGGTGQLAQAVSAIAVITLCGGMAATGQQRGSDRVTDQVAIAHMNMSSRAGRASLASRLAQRRFDLFFGLGGGHIHVAQALGHQLREAAAGEGEQILDLVAAGLLLLPEGCDGSGLVRGRLGSRGGGRRRRHRRRTRAGASAKKRTGLSRHIGKVVHFVLVHVGGSRNRLFQDIDKPQLFGLGAIEPGICRQ
ncbi:hypothetical protein D3C79_453770 [compost metagenome]